MKRGYWRRSDECEVRCIECGLIFEATERRLYCSVTCRVTRWRWNHPGWNAKRIAPEWLT